jgi:hypothetical protein
MTATLGGKKTFNKALNQDLELQTANMAAETPSRVQQMKITNSLRACGVGTLYF